MITDQVLVHDDNTSALPTVAVLTAEAQLRQKMQPPMTAAPGGLGQTVPEHQRSRNALLMSRMSEPSTDSHGRGTNMSSNSGENRFNLNLSDEKLANIKSPMFLKLQAMISTLEKFREEMDGSRVPKYEVAYIAKKKIQI